MKFFNLLIPFAFLYSCKAQPKLVSATNDNTLLWEISGKGIKTSYLYGTFHLMCNNDIVFSNNMKAAIKASNEVYFELDLDDPSNTFGAMLFMNMKDGKQLKDLYTPEEFERLSLFFKDSLHTPLALIQTMKPLFLQSLLYPKMMPCKNLTGVDMEILKLAKAEKKEIKGLENIQFQASVFDSIPYKVQAELLLKSIDSIEKNETEFDVMLESYKAQDLKKLESTVSENEFGSEENLEVMLYNRNKNWVAQLRDILPEKSIFMAVGAGHLVGKGGVIDLLRNAGYKVRPILNK